MTDGVLERELRSSVLPGTPGYASRKVLLLVQILQRCLAGHKCFHLVCLECPGGAGRDKCQVRLVTCVPARVGGGDEERQDEETQKESAQGVDLQGLFPTIAALDVLRVHHSRIQNGSVNAGWKLTLESTCKFLNSRERAHAENHGDDLGRFRIGVSRMRLEPFLNLLLRRLALALVSRCDYELVGVQPHDFLRSFEAQPRCRASQQDRPAGE